MATTMRLIGKQTLATTAATVTFSNIPGTYTDLLLVMSARTDRSNAYEDTCRLQFNGDTGNNYATRMVYQFSSSIGNESVTSQNGIKATGSLDGPLATASTFGNAEFVIPNYAGSTNKSVSHTGVAEHNGGPGIICITTGLWSSTAAITSITTSPWFGTNFVIGSSFYLYGITKMDDGEKGYFGTAATGGDEVYTTGNGYKVHVFKNSGILNVTAPGEVEYLVIAGGGGAGVGGGGAGGYRSSVGGENSGGGSQNEKPLYLYPGNYSILVGAGGNGANATNGTATSGSDSIFSTIVSKGGGRGGSDPNNGGATPGSGGSGGAAYASAAPGSGTTGQGYAARQGAAETGGSGGGGAGSLGVALTIGLGGGAGGSGVSSNITGSSIPRASGGGGGRTSASAVAGGGGAGSAPSGGGSTDGQPNTGGGGGGETVTPVPGIGKNGGSGIVIIRYRI